MCCATYGYVRFCHPLTRFICSGDPQNRRTDARASDNNDTGGPLLIGHLYHLKVAIGQILIYADNCQKRRKRGGSALWAHIARMGRCGRTMETHADSRGSDEFDVVFINTNNNNNNDMMVLLLLILHAAADKHSIRPGRQRPKFEINSFGIYILYRILLRRAGRSRTRFNLFR